MASTQGKQEQENKQVARQPFEGLDRQDIERMGKLVSSINHCIRDRK